MSISFPSALLFNTWLIYSSGWIFKKIEKARQESECPIFSEIPVISPVSLKFSAYPIENLKVLASLSMPEFTTYLRIISHLLFYTMVSSTIANQTFNFQKNPLYVLKLGLRMLHFLDRTSWQSRELGSMSSGWAARGLGSEEIHKVSLEWESIPAEIAEHLTPSLISPLVHRTRPLQQLISWSLNLGGLG